MQSLCKQRGFTLLEILITTAIIAILGLVALASYQRYTAKAEGVDVIEKYDGLKTRMNIASAGTNGAGACTDVASQMAGTPLAHPDVAVGTGFTPVAGGGYRPVLTVCASLDKQGPKGLSTARGIYEALEKNGVVEKGQVLTDSVVSFALQLTPADRAMCSTPVAPQPDTRCGTPPTQTAGQPAAPTLPPAQTAAPAQPATQGGQVQAPAQAAAAAQPPAQVAAAGTPAPRPQPRTGKQCLVCGDRDAQMPCSDMDVVLAVMTQCPNDQPYCLNTYTSMDDGSGVKMPARFSACADESKVVSALRASRSNPKCAAAIPSGAIVGPSGESLLDDAVCATACYGDKCNTDGPGPLLDPAQQASVGPGNRLLIGGK